MAKHVEPIAESWRTGVQIPPAPPILKPQLLSVGAFSCLFAPVPACCWGLLRTPADFDSRPKRPFPATFHSLLDIPRSDLAPWHWPEVRKGRNVAPYRSKGYARTNQSVGLQHWLGHGINEDRLTCPFDTADVQAQCTCP